MIILINNKYIKCIIENCNNNAIYGNIINYKKIYCYEHKDIEENIINITKKTLYCKICLYSRGSFKYPDKKGLYCIKCKTYDMISINIHNCIICNETRPSFGYEENDEAKHCDKCKLEDMIDLVHDRCNCKFKKRAIFGIPDSLSPTHCINCKTEDMIDIANKSKMCIKCKDTRGTFGYENNKKEVFCSKCKLPDMINIVDKLCKSNEQNIICLSIANKKYNGYCMRCFSYLFPNDPLNSTIRLKTYELQVRDFLNTNYSDFEYNKLLNIGGCDCSHRRFIDHYKFVNGCLLAIETDENQHKDYDEIKEEERINDIVMIYTYPNYFIRFSPNGRVYSKDGKYKNPSIELRLLELKNEINKAIIILNDDNQKKELLTNVYLFYDEL